MPALLIPELPEGEVVVVCDLFEGLREFADEMQDAEQVVL
jgi:hypothetical protein